MFSLQNTYIVCQILCVRASIIYDRCTVQSALELRHFSLSIRLFVSAWHVLCRPNVCSGEASCNSSDSDLVMMKMDMDLASCQLIATAHFIDLAHRKLEPTDYTSRNRISNYQACPNNRRESRCSLIWTANDWQCSRLRPCRRCRGQNTSSFEIHSVSAATSRFPPGPAWPQDDAI